MTQPLPSEKNVKQQTKIVVDPNKSFFDLSAAEIEQLAIAGTDRAREQMHERGIPTIISLNENVYEEHPNGSLTLIHEQPEG